MNADYTLTVTDGVLEISVTCPQCDQTLTQNVALNATPVTEQQMQEFVESKARELVRSHIDRKQIITALGSGTVTVDRP